MYKIDIFAIQISEAGDSNMQPSNQYIQEQYYRFSYMGRQYGTKQ
jgi:hypothetical protein